MKYVVTGASRGIGYEFIRQLSANPDNQVIALVRNIDNAWKLKEIGSSNIHVVQADLTDWKSLKAAAIEVNKITGGSLDCLINNAAYIQDKRRYNNLTDYTAQEELLEKDFTDNFRVNVTGIIHTVNFFLPLLQKGDTKKVITLTSGLGDVDFTLASNFSAHVPYSASKAALNMVMAKYAVQFRRHGFVFASIAPGYVDTSTVPPTAEEVETGITMCENFREAAPWWNGTSITPEVSVREMLETIGKLRIEESGTRIARKGDKEWL